MVTPKIIFHKKTSSIIQLMRKVILHLLFALTFLKNQSKTFVYAFNESISNSRIYNHLLIFLL